MANLYNSEAGSDDMLLDTEHCDVTILRPGSDSLPYGTNFKFEVTMLDESKESYPKNSSSWMGKDKAARTLETIKQTDWVSCKVSYQ